MTDVQQAYWIGRLEGFELGNVATHAYMEMESEGLDVERFERAFRRLIERHEMLRAIVDEDGRQRILKEVPEYRVEVLDLRGQSEAEVEEELLGVRERMSHQVLPADQWPLFEIRASQITDRRIRLHLGIDC